MEVEAIVACDAVFEGRGHPAFRTKALFPGIRYELPDGLAAGLIAAGKVRRLGPPAPAAEADPGARVETRIVGRAQGRKR